MKTIIAALIVSLVAASSTLAVPLYEQPWAGSPFLRASQNDTSAGGVGNYATAYDNFTLVANGAIGNVAWTGGWFSPPVQGTITSFTISFWADNAGQPGGLLQSYFISGNASETFITSSVFSELYSYSANLGSAFNALAGTQYWLSIVANTPDGVDPQWGWAPGAGGDGISYQDFSGTPRTQEPLDLAFSLNSANGNAVPESGATVLLLGGVVIGLALLRKRFPLALS